MSEPIAESDSSPLSELLEQLQSNAPEKFEAARQQLMEHAGRRLEGLTRRMLRNDFRLRRWEETADVFQNAVWRLYRSLESVRPATPGQFFGLAATQIRRELIDLARHHFGPEGPAAHHHTDLPGQPAAIEQMRSGGAEPATLEEWSRFHEAVDQLPEAERDVIHLLWYDGLSQLEAAALLKVSDRTIKARWRNAKLLLRAALEGSNLA